MPTVLKVLITVVSLAAGSFGVAYAWQNSDELLTVIGLTEANVAVSADTESISEGTEPETDLNEEISETDSPEPVSISEQESSGGESAEIDNPVYAREALKNSIPASAAVEYSYFNDAIFFGDSISTGIPLYMKTVVPDAEVIAYQGVSPGGAATAKCIEVDGVEMTMLEAAKLKGERKKIYIMLGANALDANDEAFMSGYRAFVEEVKNQYPEAAIYIQSMLPVTATVNQVYKSPSINNERIAALNAEIRDMAVSMGVYYVDVAQCMVDKDGFLPTEASPVDGMHLNPEYYYKWFDYLREHTAPFNK